MDIVKNMNEKLNFVSRKTRFIKLIYIILIYYLNVIIPNVVSIFQKKKKTRLTVQKLKRTNLQTAGYKNKYSMRIFGYTRGVSTGRK